MEHVLLLSKGFLEGKCSKLIFLLYFFFKLSITSYLESVLKTDYINNLSLVMYNVGRIFEDLLLVPHVVYFPPGRSPVASLDKSIILSWQKTQVIRLPPMVSTVQRK